MQIISYTLLSFHFILLGILCLFGIHRLSMVIRWLFYKNSKINKPDSFSQLPKVTVQIPLFNERFVAKRVIEAIVKIDYPSDKLQLQIVDDSTDETKDIVAKEVAYFAAKGINIQHVHRTNRQGFKAGALKEAMESVSGEFIAIFDADFIPYPSIIKETIDQFTDNKVAMVQFRWEHLNRFRSKLTETQAIMLDAHFGLEQNVRHASDVLFNFNGTAGIWRTEAIIDAGHWSADTLTEDLDLSYRAQLKGWKLVYLNHISCPAELPADMNAFKSQQHRWAKGGIQVMKKMLMTVWCSPLSLRHKLESTFHLSNNLAYFVMLVDTLFLLIPSLVIRQTYQLSHILWIDLPLLILSSGGHLIYFFFGQVALNRSKWGAISNMPRALLLGVQLAFNNARAATEAIIGQESEFVRTPKSGDNQLSTENVKALDFSQKLYRTVLPNGSVFEFLIACVYLVVFVWGVYYQLWFMLPFLLLLIIGFLTTAIDGLVNKYRLGTR